MTGKYHPHCGTVILMKKINWEAILVNLAILLLCIFPPSDVDLGWHLRYGEYFFQHGRILRENIFSYTFPGYQWVNHSWLYDPIVYLVFKSGGFLLVSLFGALLLFVAVKILSRAVRATSLEQIIIAFAFVYLGVHSLAEGVRSRHVTFVFLAVQYLILQKRRENGHYLLILPPLYILWANLHGTFTEGLLYLFFVCLADAVNVCRDRKANLPFWLKLAAIGMACGLAALINPFGMHVFEEAFKHSSDSHLEIIDEFIKFSLILDHSIGFLIYMGIIAAGLIWQRKKEYFIEALPLAPFLYLSFNGARHIAIFALLSLPLAVKLVRPVLAGMYDLPYYRHVFRLSLVIIAVYLLVNVSRNNILSYSWDDYCRFSTDCSEGSVQYLHDNPPKGYGFNSYDWGGYLIWRVPGIKPFIDGRMHLWQVNGHYIIDDYLQLMNALGYGQNAYYGIPISWVIIPTDSDLSKVLSSGALAGWKTAYRDSKASIYIHEGEKHHDSLKSP